MRFPIFFPPPLRFWIYLSRLPFTFHPLLVGLVTNSCQESRSVACIDIYCLFDEQLSGYIASGLLLCLCVSLAPPEARPPSTCSSYSLAYTKVPQTICCFAANAAQNRTGTHELQKDYLLPRLPFTALPSRLQ